jgi:DNA-binding response OmpR family regulator
LTLNPSARLPRILVVEDNAAMADIIRRRLCLEGFEPVMCASGTLAKVLLDRDTFDAVLLDVMMPDVDGYDVLRHIRAMPLTLPVIMLTAKAGLEDREKAEELGANAYVTKPFSSLGLVNTLRTLLARTAAAATPARV